jgi:hypothetical protein
VDDKAVGHHPVLCFASVNVELNLETFHTQQVPVITAPLPVDPGAKYPPGTFPYFKGMSDRITYVVLPNTMDLSLLCVILLFEQKIPLINF